MLFLMLYLYVFVLCMFELKSLSLAVVCAERFFPFSVFQYVMYNVQTCIHVSNYIYAMWR